MAYDEIPEDITDDEFLPSCCDETRIELCIVEENLRHICVSCGTRRQELD